MKVAVNDTKHICKRYTHAIAKVSILWRQNNNDSGTNTSSRACKSKTHMLVHIRGTYLWGARRASTSEKKMSFASQGCIFSKHHFSRASREGTQGCGEPDVLAHSDKALRSQRHAIMHDPNFVASSASAQRQLIWHAGIGRAGPRRGAFIPFGVRAAASCGIPSPTDKQNLLPNIFRRIRKLSFF